MERSGHYLTVKDNQVRYTYSCNIREHVLHLVLLFKGGGGDLIKEGLLLEEGHIHVISEYSYGGN